MRKIAQNLRLIDYLNGEIRPQWSIEKETQLRHFYNRMREFTRQLGVSVVVNERVYHSNSREKNMENPVLTKTVVDCFLSLFNREKEPSVCLNVVIASNKIRHLPFDQLPLGLRKFANMSRGMDLHDPLLPIGEQARVLMCSLREALLNTHKNDFGVEEWPICYRRKEIKLLKEVLEKCQKAFEKASGKVGVFPIDIASSDHRPFILAVLEASGNFRAHDFMKQLIAGKGVLPKGYILPRILTDARLGFMAAGILDRPLSEMEKVIPAIVDSVGIFRKKELEQILQFFAAIHRVITGSNDANFIRAIDLGFQCKFLTQSEKSDLLRRLSGRDYSAPSQSTVTEKPQDPSTRATDSGENMKKSFTFQLLSDVFSHMGLKAECRLLPTTLLENLDKAKRKFAQIGAASSVSNLIRKRQYSDLYRFVMDTHRESFMRCFGTLSDPKSNSDILSPALPHWALIFAFLCYAPKNNQLPEEAIRAILDIVRITESVTPEEYVDLEELAGIDEQDDRASALNEFIVAVNTFKGNMYHLLMTLLTSHREYGIDLNTNPTEAENLYRKADIFLEKWGVVPHAPIPLNLVDLVKDMSVCRAEFRSAPILDLVMFFTNLKLYITEKNDNYFPGLVSMAAQMEFITKEQAATLNQKFIEKKDLVHNLSEFQNMCPRYRRECPDREINTIGDIVHILREFVCPKVFNAGTGYFYQPSPYRWLSGQCVCSAYTRAEDRVLERRCLMDQKTGAVLAKEMSKQTPFTIAGKPVDVSSPHLDTNLMAFDKMVSASQRLEIVRRLRTIATTGACMQQGIMPIELAAHELMSFSGAMFDLRDVMKGILFRGPGSLPIVMSEIEKVLDNYIDRKQITEKCYRILVFLATVLAYQDASSDYRFSKEDLIFLLSRCRNDGLIVQSEYESLLRIGCR